MHNLHCLFLPDVKRGVNARGKVGPNAVFVLDQVDPVLMTTRTIGDLEAVEWSNGGIISSPEITYKRLDKSDRFLVFGTQSVFMVMSSTTVCKVIAEIDAQKDRDPHLAAKRVIEKARERWEKKLQKQKEALASNDEKEDMKISAGAIAATTDIPELLVQVIFFDVI